MPLLVLLYLLAERLIATSLLLGVALLLLKDGGCLVSLMALVNRALPMAVSAARMASSILVLIAFSIASPNQGR